MPIELEVQAKNVSSETHRAVVFQVTGLAMAVRRDLGCLWNERIYRNELAHRCRQNGFAAVRTEVPIRISHQSFAKTLYIDLLIDDAVVFELKAAREASNSDYRQALNYLILSGVQHGALLNMLGDPIRPRLVSTSLTEADRRQYRVVDDRWLDTADSSRWLKSLLLDLLADWGAFVDTSLLYEAVVHFRGGAEAVIGSIEASEGPRRLGAQRMHLLSSDVAFCISAITRQAHIFEQDLRRVLSHTPLKAIHWINLAHHAITLASIVKQ